MTESAARSRLIQRGEPHGRLLYLRDKAEQAIRLARDSTDPVLQKSLNELAREYLAQANAIDGTTLGEDPEDE